MASSKKSTTETKNKEAGTSKSPTKSKSKPKAKTAAKSGKRKKICSKNHAGNGSAKDNDVSDIPAPDSRSTDDDADEDRTETTSRKPSSSKSKKVKRTHVKNEENGYEEEEEPQAEEKLCKFPMHRIKKIMRDENSDLRINQEALFLVNKATEVFLVQFCKDAYACCAQERKKSLAYKHLSSVVCKRKRYDFLSDFVPEKLRFEDALKERSVAESEKG